MKCEIQFINGKVKEAFEKLEKGDASKKKLKYFLNRAFSDICENAFCGIQLPKRLIPKEYLQKFGVNYHTLKCMASINKLNKFKIH